MHALVVSAKTAHTVYMSNAYKDSLFRSLFNNKKSILSLYNAIYGTDYDENTEVTINTLAETLFTNQKNDVSAFIENNLVIIYEHQATPNANMPFRFLSIIARLLENSVSDKTTIYREKLIKFPRPVFIVLYNGRANCPDRRTMKLSDAFEKMEGLENANLELIVEFWNINKGHNEELVNKCEPLAGYVEFVHIVRKKEMELRKEKPGVDRKTILEEAIAYGVTYCKEHEILREFFEELSMEEQNMLATEWDWNEAVRVSREEAWEDGWEKGEEKGKRDGWEEAGKSFFDLIGRAESMDDLKKMVEVSLTKRQSNSAGS
jgi:hypothetical protein